MEKSYYTRLTYELKMPDDDGVHRAVIEEPSWDTNGREMFDMFRKIWIAAGYLPDGFYLQCAEFAEEHSEDDVK